MRGRCSGAIPEPVSATETVTPPGAGSSETAIRPAGGVYRRALSNRLVSTCRNASESAVTQRALRSEEDTAEIQAQLQLGCPLLLVKKKKRGVQVRWLLRPTRYAG